MKQEQLIFPLIEAIEDMGGKAKAKDVYRALAKKVNLPGEERDKKVKGKTWQTNYWERKCRWVKQYAKWQGLIEDSEKGVWHLTEKAKKHLKNARPGILLTAYTVLDSQNRIRGIALWGEMQSAMGFLEKGCIDLIITSPPYPLSTPKDYGNVMENTYVDWFLPLAELMAETLNNKGSIILNLGDVWKKGLPIRSSYKERLLIKLEDELGFKLAQKFFWYNPAKLPAGYWTCNTRERVKDSVEEIFWLTKGPHVNSSNLKVLKEYSEQYKNDLRRGGYKGKYRPSGHDITHFKFDNGGSIPENFFNLLVGCNSDASSPYHKGCKEHGLIRHPARFPRLIPEFFVKFLTEEEDLVWDPFGGSNMVGEVCYDLNRKFIITEKSLAYLEGSRFRFPEDRVSWCIS